MSRTFKVFTTALLITTFIPHSQPSAQGTAYSPWAMFGGNPQHTHRGVDAPPATSDILWEYELDNNCFSSPVIGPSGTVYVTAPAILYALNPNDHLKWTYRFPNSIMHLTPAVDFDETVYIPAKGSVIALNSDATLKWEVATKSLYTSPVVAADGTVYQGSFGGQLYSIDPAGTVNWIIDIPRSIDVRSVPAVDDSGTVYIGATYLYAYNPDGSMKWVFDDNSPNQGIVQYSSPAIGEDGTIYIGGTNGYFYAVNPDGTLKWKYEINAGFEDVHSSPGITPDGTIIIGGDELYAFNPDGTVKWRYPIECRKSSPAIGHDGTVYIGHRDGSFYAINPDGTLRWQYQFDNDAYFTPAIGSDGTLYVAPYTKTFYAFAPEEPTAITEEPASFHVNTPYPNPFNANVTIEYVIPHGGHVRCAVYDMLGRKVATPKEGILSAGTHRAVWDGRDALGCDAASGTYFFRIEADGLTKSGKVMLLR